MKILHIITSLRMGGAERLVADMLPRLRSRGHRVELLLFDGTRTPLFEQLERQGIAIHTLGRGVLQMWNPLHLFRLKKYLRNRRYDIVHTHNTPCQLLTAMAAPKAAPLLVTTEHNTTNRRRNWAWFDKIERMMYGKYRHIACVSRRTKENLERKLGAAFDAADISVVENGIDLSRFLTARADMALRTPDERDKKIVVMVAAFRPQKDQPTLIRAMRHLPDDYRLWLVGEGPEQSACRRLAEKAALTDRVRFLGVRSDVPELLAASDVVVLSSHYEGMSLASIEGMASGKPFIASDVDGLCDTVADAAPLFPHEDSRQLAGLVRQLCEDLTLYESVASRCREKALGFDIETVVDKYEKVYKRYNTAYLCKIILN